MLSRDHVLALMRERVHHPAGLRELLQLLKVPREERATFKRLVKSLVETGDLIQIRGQRFGLPEKMDLFVGRLQTHAGGYGFVEPERPLESGGDIYIAGPHLNEAMHGDRVVVRIERIREGGRAEGRVIRILERVNTWLVGRYERDENGMGYVVPFDRRVLMDIVVPPGQEGGASPGEMVTLELTRWPTSTRGAIGRVAEVLGDVDAPGVDTDIIIRKYGLPDTHSAEAVREATSIGAEVGQGDLRGRTDFRPIVTVTIDGEHARDFDDAITIEKLANGNYWLGVHIADVSHYVREGSALDEEAYARGTSVYFPERAVHMFPAELATGICSLNPRVDRLVLVNGHIMGVLEAQPHQILERWRDITSAEERRAIFKRNLASLMFANPDNIDDLAVHIYEGDLPRSRVRPPKFINKRDLSMLNRLGCRIYNIAGEHDPLGTPSVAEQQAWLKRERPDAEIRMVRGAGHWVMYEAADAFNDILLRVLA